MEYFKLLPKEMILEILTRLPTESVLDSKLVCTNWRKIISNHPSFSKMQLHHLNHPFAESGKLGFLVSTHRQLDYVEFDENHDPSTTAIRRVGRIDFTSPFKYFSISFVGSINGLVCLLENYVLLNCLTVCICNPITKECVRLPEIKKRDGDIEYETFSFGYISSTNEYKIVGFYKYKTHFEVHIYTLGSGSGWRNVGKFNYGSESLYLKYQLYFANGALNCASNVYFRHMVFFVNGALYWLDRELKMIGTFNLAEEKFGEYLSPPSLPPDTDWIGCTRIGVLGELLFFALENKVDRFEDIWILEKKNRNHDKKEGEEHHSFGWKKDIRNHIMGVLAVSKSGHAFTFSGCYLNICDTKTSTTKSVVKLNSYILGVFPHENTLVSLKELGEESAKIEDTRSGEQLDTDPEYIYL